MTIELTPQLIITAGAVLTASAALIGAVAKAVRWMDEQEKQSKEIKDLKAFHKTDTDHLREDMKHEQAHVNEELTLLTYGVLACLKGLKEQGCNGPVTEAIGKIEKHLNQKAHDM